MEPHQTACLIDANVCVGFFDQDDQLHAQAKAAVEDIQSQGTSGIVFDHIIQETLTVLLYSAKNDAASYFVEAAFQNQDLHIIDTPVGWILDAMRLAKSQNFQPKMSTIDWLLLSRSIATGVPILTFDKQLLAAAKKLC